MNWLITGGCGFIGLNLVKFLREDKNNKVCIIDDLSIENKKLDLLKISNIILTDEYKDFNIYNNDGIELIVYDISKDLRNDIKYTISKSDIIVHLAALSGIRPSIKKPKEWFDVNVKGTFNLLNAAKNTNVKKIIFASTGSVLGDQKPPFNEKMLCKPNHPYGASKLCCESYMTSFYHSYGLETVSLRFSNVYGPYSNHKKSLIANTIKHILNNEPPEIYGDGSQKRDYIYVSDLINAIYKCSITENIGGEVFQISTGFGVSVIDVVDRIKTFTDSNHMITTFSAEKPGDTKLNWADNTKAKRLLDWYPEIPLIEGIEKTIGWFKEWHTQNTQMK